jgi:hypothetical protein
MSKLVDIANPNGVVAKGDIPRVVKFIAQIEKEHGKITPELIVQKGRVPGTPVYKYFTNNTSEAAAKRWLDEARIILRSVYIYVESASEKDRAPVRKWICVEPTESNPTADGYMDVVKVFADDELRKQIIDRAIQDIEIWKDRYKALKQFSVQIATIFKALEKVHRKVGVKGGGHKKRPK